MNAGRLEAGVRRWLARHPGLKARLVPLADRLKRARAQAGSRPPPWPGRLWMATLPITSRIGLTVSEADIVWCYREMLGRDPEPGSELARHAGARNLRAVIDAITRTPEYVARAGTAAAARPETVAITADDFRRSIEIYFRNHTAGSQEARNYAQTHFDRLLHTLNVLRDRVPRGAHVLDYSAAGFFAHAVRQLIGDVEQSSVTGVNFEMDDYVPRLGEGRYDLCLNTEVLEHLAFDPAYMVHSISRLLKPAGLLFLSTPNAVSMVNALKVLDGHSPALWNQFRPSAPYYERHNREWSPSEVCRLLQDHGFEIVASYSRDFYASSRQYTQARAADVAMIRSRASHDDFGDTLCVIARKLCVVPEPVRPAWLYA